MRADNARHPYHLSLTGGGLFVSLWNVICNVPINVSLVGQWCSCAVAALPKAGLCVLPPGLDNMRDPGILDPRHFFSPGTFTRFTRFLHNFTRFYMIFAQFSMIFAQFYANFAIFTRFFVIFTRFLRFLRDFCDFYAIFCQAKILASQAPKTIMQACIR